MAYVRKSYAENMANPKDKMTDGSVAMSFCEVIKEYKNECI